jgi:hypothetical protein
VSHFSVWLNQMKQWKCLGRPNAPNWAIH